MRHIEDHAKRSGGIGDLALEPDAQDDVDDVSAATGVLRGSLYAAFGNKRSLFLRTFADYCKRTEPALCSALSGPDDEAVQRLRTYLLSAAHFVLDDEERLGCMATKLAT